MKSAIQFQRNRFRSIEDEPYATTDDFQRLFTREMVDLFRLSLHLTADAEKADMCLILAIRDCFANSNVGKNWALVWARRMVVCNAIRLVMGTEGASPGIDESNIGPEIHLRPSEYRIEALRESLAILELPDLDRLVFVICVLERYPILDCALLLRRSVKDVACARVRAISQIVSVEERNQEGTSATSPSRLRSACRNGMGQSDDPCGSLLD